MRFSAIILVAAFAGMVAAAPISQRSLVTEVGGTVKEVDDASGVTALEDDVDAASGGAVGELEDKTGITYAEDTLNLEKRQGDIQTVGAGVKKIEDGAGVTATEDFLDEESGGALTSAEDALGVTDVDKAIGAERK